MAATDKPIQTLVVDTGAVIKNDPAASTLLKQAENLVTVPSIISEIRDPATRSRFETTLKPFLTVRSPSAASIKFVTDFARRTGDLAVLSRPDVEIIALTYELECEKNGGDWRLRRAPGQKNLNGKTSQAAAAKGISENSGPAEGIPTAEGEAVAAAEPSTDAALCNEVNHVRNGTGEGGLETAVPTGNDDSVQQQSQPVIDEVASQLDRTQLDPNTMVTPEEPSGMVESVQSAAENTVNSDSGSGSDSDSDSDGWITPAKLEKTQASNASRPRERSKREHMKVAVITSDFTMQNVILQINLNLLSPSMSRVRQIRSHVLRCHACFQICKDMNKQFCPRCGQPTLTRVSCSTNAKGEFKLFLKKNYQYNARGDRYSIPKPVHGSANGKIKGGGKGGWGNDLMLAEDQKEYQAATKEHKRHRERDLLDPDYLPSILTGDRKSTGGKVRVGAGRTVNSRKR